MISRWNDADAPTPDAGDLAMRVHTSRLLGADDALVMHGGGNTSVKSRVRDLFGDEIEVLFVKGSGWDLKTIQPTGFPALRLEGTRRLATLETLPDLEMARQLRALMLDPSGPAPSVEAILHSIIPARFVDHTHADAVVTLSNTLGGEARVRELYPDCLVLPYVMPGFVLARQVHGALARGDARGLAGIILLHHGVFTFDDDARRSYEKMIALVDRAERAIAAHARPPLHARPGPPDLLRLARIRREVSRARGRAQLAVLDASPEAAGYASRRDIPEISTRGPITPDHVLRTKRVPVVIAEAPADGVPEIRAFAEDYAHSFAQHAQPHHTMLDPAPRAAVWRSVGTIAFGDTLKECRIIADIAQHTAWAVQIGEALGGWAALSPTEIFEVEYWSLEQAKFAGARTPPVHTGKVALVTGAAGGIGRAACAALAEDGATVVGIDIEPRVRDELRSLSATGLACDVTDPDAVRAAVEHTVRSFGGLDILVCNAGIFRTGERLDAHTDQTWDRTLAVNLTAVQRLITIAAPYLKLGVEPSVLVVGSRNVRAPGPGAAAYSVSKAGLTQLARVAAIELASDGVRVNIVHPDAVFDTGLWTEDALRRSAERYGLTVEQYKARNLLGVEITSRDVARVLSLLAGPAFRATTAAQIPIDGGNDRVI